VLVDGWVHLVMILVLIVMREISGFISWSSLVEYYVVLCFYLVSLWHTLNGEETKDTKGLTS